MKHPTAYASKLEAGTLPIFDSEDVSEQARLEERAMLELRLATGLDLSVVSQLNSKVADAVAALIAASLIDGVAALSGTVILTVQGRLMADFVLRKLLGL